MLLKALLCYYEIYGVAILILIARLILDLGYGLHKTRCKLETRRDEILRFWCLKLSRETSRETINFGRDSLVSTTPCLVQSLIWSLNLSIGLILKIFSFSRFPTKSVSVPKAQLKKPHVAA